MVAPTILEKSVEEYLDDEQNEVGDDDLVAKARYVIELVEKGGTSKGAILGWVRRRQAKMQDMLAAALQSRDPRKVALAQRSVARWKLIRQQVEARLAGIHVKSDSEIVIKEPDADVVRMIGTTEITVSDDDVAWIDNMFEKKAGYEEAEHPRAEDGKWTDADNVTANRQADKPNNHFTGSPVPSEVDSPKKSPFDGGPHIYRRRLADKKEVRVLKNGEKKTVMVPQYKFFDGITHKEITNKAKLDEIRGIVPPGVSNVRINVDGMHTTGLAATWIDSKGLMQRKYGVKHDKSQAAEKFERLKVFNKALPKIRKRVREDMEGEDPKRRQLALVVYMIDKTGFRLGGSYSNTDVQAYGASTLLNKHVKIKGNKVTFDFTGKHGVDIHQVIRDQKLADELAKTKTSKWSEPLFEVSPGQVYGYIKEIGGFKFTTKDFRTWNGTNVAWKEIKKRQGPAKDEKTFNKWQKEVAEAVAKKLNNKPAVCLGSYIDPHAWDPWRQPAWGPYVPKKLKDEDDD